MSEHVILPKDAPYPPSPAFLEPILTLAWAAAATKRVRLGTSVIVLPMHHPVPIAKQLATLQTLSNGRVIFGIGVGWLEAEFSALGVSFRERGRRTDESIALLRALWSQDPVTFKPRYWATQIEEMRMQPPPSAPIPLWVGGSSDKALQRAVKLCDGWHGSRLTAEAAAPVIKRLRTVRPDKTFTISLRTSFDGKDPFELGARLGAYRDAGPITSWSSPKIATSTTGCARWRRSPARGARISPRRADIRFGSKTGSTELRCYVRSLLQ